MPATLPGGYDIPPQPGRAAGPHPDNFPPAENSALRAHYDAVSPGTEHYCRSSSNPQYARNPGGGEPLATASILHTARQAVYHDPARPSAVPLPVVPPGSDNPRAGRRGVPYGDTLFW
jgi:hypothetical protein